VPNAKKILATVLVLIVTVAIAAVDVLLPQDIETDFLYTLPILLCVRTGQPLLPALVAAIAVAWTLAVDLYLVMTQPEPPATFTANLINDLFGIISVVVLAVFVARRMRRESDLHSIIRFMDGRLRPDDNIRLHRMREMTRMMSLDDESHPGPLSPL
jgi:hypothetical protein